MLKRGIQASSLDELHAPVVRVEAGVERDRHQEAEHRADERDRALQPGALRSLPVASTSSAAEDRDPDRRG